MPTNVKRMSIFRLICNISRKVFRLRATRLVLIFLIAWGLILFLLLRVTYPSDLLFLLIKMGLLFLAPVIIIFYLAMSDKRLSYKIFLIGVVGVWTYSSLYWIIRYPFVYRETILISQQQASYFPLYFEADRVAGKLSRFYQLAPSQGLDWLLLSSPVSISDPVIQKFEATGKDVLLTQARALLFAINIPIANFFPYYSKTTTDDAGTYYERCVSGDLFFISFRPLNSCPDEEYLRRTQVFEDQDRGVFEF